MQTTTPADRLTLAGALDISLQYYADGEAWWACADMFLLNRGLKVSTGDRTNARVPCHANRKA